MEYYSVRVAMIKQDYIMNLYGKNKLAGRGQALVEFALVLPVLLILCMLIIQYGVIFYTTISLTNLSREGARYAATAPVADDPIKTRMRDVLPGNIVWSDIQNNISITANPSNSRSVNSGGLITVQITYDMRKKLFLPSTFLGVHIFNTAYVTKTTMMIE